MSTTEPTAKFRPRRDRVLRVDLNRWVDDARMRAEEMLLGIRADDPGYDDLPADLSTHADWPKWGASVVDEATAFAKLGNMMGWSNGKIESAILYSIDKHLRLPKYGLDGFAQHCMIARARRSIEDSDFIGPPPPIAAPLLREFFIEPKTAAETLRDDHRFAFEALGSVNIDDQIKHGEMAFNHALGKIWAARVVDPLISDVKLEGVADRAVWDVFDRLEPAERATAPSGPAGANPLDGVTLGQDVDWTHAGGLLGMMTDWILSVSFKPNRPLAAAGALAALSAICGRRLYSPTSSALNLILPLLGDSTVGKDDPLKSAQRLLREAGLGDLVRTAKTFTVSGYETILRKTAVAMTVIDEMGDNLLVAVTHDQASAIVKQIFGFLREITSIRFNSPPFAFTQRADVDLKKSERAGILTEVEHPSFTMIGASTVAQFYGALTLANINNGFANRLTPIMAAPGTDEHNYDTAGIPVPDDIIDAIRAIAVTGVGDLAISSVPLTYTGPTVFGVERQCVEWESPDVRQRYNDFDREMISLARLKPRFGPLISRIPETSLRVATLAAVSRCCPNVPTVGLADLEIGAAMVVSGMRDMLTEEPKHMAETPFEKLQNRIMAEIWASSKPMSRTGLSARIRGVKSKDMEDAIKFLVEIGLLDETKKDTTGRSATLYYAKGK
jgi:hypothetical protein